MRFDSSSEESFYSFPSRSRRIKATNKRILEHEEEISPIPKKKKTLFHANLLNLIPDDVFFHSILLFLPLRNLVKIRLVCKYFDRLILTKWLSECNCKFIPILRSYHNIRNGCDFTNLLVELLPEQELMKFYSKFQNVMNLYCKDFVDCYLMKDVPFSRLESLYLMRCNLSGADTLLLFQSTHLTNLKTVCLDFNRLRGDGNFNLILNRNILPKLETLSVTSNCLSDDCTIPFRNENVSNLPINFHTLIIDDNRITTEGQFTLLTNEKLRILSIDGKHNYFFHFTEPLKLKFLKVKSDFKHNTEMSCNTTISESKADFPKLENGMYLEHLSVRRLIFYSNFEYYFYNHYTNDSMRSNNEKYFYIDKLLNQSSTNSKRRGELYELKKEWENAIVEYKTTNSIDRIAFIYYRKMSPPNYELALSNFMQCTLLNFGTNQFSEEIAICSFKRGKYEMALNYFEKVLPNLSPKSFELLGICCYRLKQYSKAIEFLSKFELIGDESKITLAYSILEGDITKKDVAVGLLLDLVKRRNNEAIYFLGSIYENGLYSFEKNEKKAIEFYSLLEHDDLANFSLGKIYLNLNKEKAIKVFRNINWNFERYGEVSCMLAILLKDINQEESCDYLIKSATLRFQDCLQPIVDHFLSSISYDWSFLLPSEYTLKKTKIPKCRDLFNDQFSHNSVTPEKNEQLITLVNSNFKGYNFDSIKISHLQMARFLFFLGKFNECKKYYQKLLDCNEEAEKFLLFFLWLTEHDIPEYMVPIIEKHLETNIYAQYLFVKHNFDGNSRKSKIIFERCKHLFDMTDFEIIISMNVIEDERVVSLCKSSLMSYSVSVIERIINYSIERDLIDFQNYLVSNLEDHYEFDESIIPIECIRLLKEGKEKDLLRSLFLSYPNKKVFHPCLKHISNNSTNEIYGLLLKFQERTQDDINVPIKCFYSELIWVLFINGKDSKALEYSQLLFSSDQILENLLTNCYDPVQYLIGMHQTSYSLVSKKIYLQKHPNISKVFQHSKDIASLISHAIEEKIIPCHQFELIFGETLKYNLTNRNFADIAFSMKLGKKAIKYNEKCSDFSKIGSIYSQGFPDIPLDYHLAIKNFKRALYFGKDTKTYYYNLGCCYLELGLYDEAIDYFSKTPFSESYVNLAKCFIAKQQYSSALAYLELVNIQKVDKQDIGKCYEELCYKLNNKEYGTKAIEIFTSIQDAHPEAKQHLEKLHNFLETIELITPTIPTIVPIVSCTLEFDEE